MKIRKSALFGKRKNYSRRFISFLSIPIILASIFTYIGNIYYTNHYRTMLISMCSNEFNRFLHSTEDIISDLSGNVSTLMSMSETKSVSDNTFTLETLDPSTAKSAQMSLLNFSTQMQDLDSIMIINRSGNFVLSTSGIHTIPYYFESVYRYKDYTLDYWLNYHSKGGNYEYLSATTVFQSDFDDGHPVVPVVFPVVNTNSNSLIVFNINLQSIYDNFLTHRFTDNSELYMINHETGEVLANTYENSTLDLSQSKTISTTNLHYLGEAKFDGDKYFIITSSQRSNIFGFTYVVKIPYSDIESQAHQVLTKILLLGSLLILAMLIYLYFGSRRLSKPWVSLAERLALDDTVGASGNIIRDIDTAITNLIDKSTGLEEKLAVSLPHSQQKYIADILNNPSAIQDENMNNLIFKYEYFISVAINISIKQTFPSTPITLNEHLYGEVYKALESVFAARFLTFSLVGTNNTLYLILNVESDNCSEDLDAVNEQIKILLSADTEYIDMFIGIGSIYKGIDGLRLSHQEAMSNIFKNMNEDKIQIFDNSNLNSYSLSVYNENILINHMLTGHGEAAIEFVKNIFTSYSKKPAEIKAQIYTDLFKALYKAIKIKKIRVPDLQTKTEYEILDELLMRSETEILTYFIELISNVTNIEGISGKASAAAIVEYIQENYNEELYLDSLAERFNTTPKYLSKMLKQHLGISFKTYLTQLRISKAEELLLDKSIKINDISKEVGFLNHSSFIRAFKIKNGISPSEYRSLHTKK